MGMRSARYYYGINELFQRHPDLVEILSRTAPVSLGQIAVGVCTRSCVLCSIWWYTVMMKWPDMRSIPLSESCSTPPKMNGCPWKRDHFQRKFHLPTFNFNGSLLLGGVSHVTLVYQHGFQVLYYIFMYHLEALRPDAWFWGDGYTPTQIPICLDHFVCLALSKSFMIALKPSVAPHFPLLQGAPVSVLWSWV